MYMYGQGDAPQRGQTSCKNLSCQDLKEERSGPMKNEDIRCMKMCLSESGQNRSRGAGGSPTKVFGEISIGHRWIMEISAPK